MATQTSDAVFVDFSGCSLKLDSEEHADEIVNGLKNNKNVTLLNLSGNTLGIPAAQPIGQELEACSQLRQCFFNDLFTGRLKSEIAPALRSLCSGIVLSGARLVELDLSDNAFGPNGVVGVVDLLSSPACSALQILRMNNQGLGHDGCRHLSEALTKGRQLTGKRGLLLKVFSGGRNRLENVGANLLSDVFADMGSLEELSLYQNGIGIHGPDGVHALIRIIRKNTHLRVLNLSDNSLKPSGGRAISNVLSSIPNLEELYLSDCILRSSGVEALCESLEDPEIVPNLRVLNLTGNELGRTVGVRLALSLSQKKQLELLDLNANEFGKLGIRSVVSALKSVDLLHVLFNSDGNQNDSNYEKEEPVGDRCHYSHAFDDDQGTASEDENDGEDENHEEYSDDCDYTGGGGDSESYVYSENEQLQYPIDTSKGDRSSIEPVVVENSVTQFSFREKSSILNNTGTFTSPSMSGAVQKAVDEHFRSPFGLGLFSSLNSCNPSNLFGSAPMKNGHLFSPPTLSFRKPEELEDQLKHCLRDPLNVQAVNKLIEIVSQSSTSSNPLSVGKLRSFVDLKNPENIIRLALRMSHQANTFDKDSRLNCLATSLLASVLAPADCSNGETGTSRAINCLLVHLGAVKAEKGGDDDLRTELRGDASELEHRLTAYFALTQRLVDVHGSHLSKDVRSCLTVLLSEQRKRERLEHPIDNISGVDRLRDDLLATLESQFAGINL